VGLVIVLIIIVAAVVVWKIYTPPTPQPEIVSKEKIVAPQAEKPSATIPVISAPSVETAPKEKVTPPSPEKVSKTITPSPPVDKADPKKMALPLPDKPSIAVLPFVNMSDDPKQEFFSDGISEDIINALVRWPPILVIPRASSFIYKGKSVDVKQVGREMGVRYVLEGSVRREGNRVRITVQLIDATTLQHLFSERYEREMKDIFAIQDEITMKVLTAMQVSLYGFGTQFLPEKGTKNIEAYVKILEADVHIQIMNRASQAQAKQLAEEAIALDPEYARAYSRLAGVIGNEFLLGVYEKNPREALERAMALAQKAIQLDDSASDAHSVLRYMALLNGTTRRPSPRPNGASPWRPIPSLHNTA
jgi:adenylate cyclase